MSSFSTPAIILRRIEFGDYDLIVTLLTLNKGKISVIAKSAKKSEKRFAGILELFSILDIVCSIGRGKGLPVLQEAALTHAFHKIRSKIIKTAYASYWAELINQWMEEGQKEVQLFHLFRYVLQELDIDQTPEAAISILFQIRWG
jgi:DNA repair protein RecO (recombination protein O)